MGVGMLKHSNIHSGLGAQYSISKKKIYKKLVKIEEGEDMFLLRYFDFRVARKQL